MAQGVEPQCRFIASDECLLLGTPPSFQLLLARDGLPYVLVAFHQHQCDRTPAVCETARIMTFLVLGKSPLDVVRNSHIELIIRTAQYVDEVVVVHTMKVIH